MPASPSSNSRLTLKTRPQKQFSNSLSYKEEDDDSNYFSNLFSSTLFPVYFFRYFYSYI